jgi:hypothetical protein
MNIVYWSVSSDLIHNSPPICIRDTYKNVDLDKKSNFNLCPSFYKEANKTYNLFAPFDYDLIFTDTQIRSSYYDQQVFDNFIQIEDFKLRLMQFSLAYIFFTEKSCNMEISAPYFSNSDFLSKVQHIPGSFNISNWFRGINAAFIVNQKVDKLEIKKGDPMLSVKFNFDNDLPIKFKKFYSTPKLNNIVSSNLRSRVFITKNVNKYLDELYAKFNRSKIKTTILKEIKDNLME